LLQTRASLAGYEADLRQLHDGVAGGRRRHRVAIGLRPYVEEDLAKGRLVALFSITVPKKRAWYLLYRAFRKDDPGLAVLRTGLRNSLAPGPPALPKRTSKGAASRST